MRRMTQDGEGRVQVMGFTATEVQATAAEAGYEMTLEQADAWLADNATKFRDRLTEFGYDILWDMLLT